MKKTPGIFSSDTPGSTDAAVPGTLKAFFEGLQGVALAFLFGSLATGRSHRESDVDIGVLFKSPALIHERQDIREQLSDVLSREVDLVPLNNASPVLKMQVLKHGVLVYAADRKFLHDFFVDTVNQYDDLKRVRKICEENILNGRIYA